MVDKVELLAEVACGLGVEAGVFLRALESSIFHFPPMALPRKSKRAEVLLHPGDVRGPPATNTPKQASKQALIHAALDWIGEVRDILPN